jgi:hypothetical protein
MPNDTTSPFTPGVPVPVDFFIGRIDELRKLHSKAQATSNGKLQVAFLAGERGIGKTSLASYLRILSTRQDKLLAVHVFLGGAHSLEDMARKVFDGLIKIAVDAPWFSKIQDLFANRIKKVDLFGVSIEFNANTHELTQLVHRFGPALASLLDRLKSEKTGILLILDDINGLSTSAEFANWLKSLVDGIATSDTPVPLFLLLVGLEDKRQDLIHLQPSLARVFDLVRIDAWTLEETEKFFSDAFATVGMTADPGALRQMATYSGGLPVIAHEIGDAVFLRASEAGATVINDHLALAGIVAASEIVGRKHLQPQVYQAIKSETHRTILGKICHSVGFRFKRSEIVQHLTEPEKRNLDNFLKKMVQLNVLINESGRGMYRFTNSLHHLYFSLQALPSKGSPQ